MHIPTNKLVDLNPRTTTYEFFGPPGALAVTILTPLTVYSLYYGCSEETGGCPPSLSLSQLTDRLSDPSTYKNLWDTQAAKLYLAWYAFCLLAWYILPGQWVEGTKLRNGGRIRYKMNGLASHLTAIGLVSTYIAVKGPASFTIIYDKFVGFITAAILMSFVQAVWWYVSSFWGDKLLALGGNSGNVFYDFFIGRELNPSIGSLDVKVFNELRPGLILWVVINISMACAQAVRIGYVTDSMWLVLAFEAWYVTDSFLHESSVLTTWDVTTDGFGFMLSFGDLAWVPFTYGLQARYLVFNPIDLGLWKTVAIFAVNATGYWIFRTSNSEKNDFRNGKNPKNLQFIMTASGSKLLTSGWWGTSRHPNYFGDLLMGLAWSLPTGFNTPITYFYVTYFLVLLIHRQIRDDERCEAKYGKDWERYKALVPYRIFPYVY